VLKKEADINISQKAKLKEVNMIMNKNQMIKLMKGKNKDLKKDQFRKMRESLKKDITIIDIFDR
jgi:hypothetical protein